MRNLKIESPCPFRGNLQIFRTDKNNKTSEVVNSSNIVLSQGKSLAANWVGAGSNYSILKMSVGNGNISNEAPSVDETGLQNELLRVPITSINIDSSNAWVTFSSEFNSGSPEFENASPAEINESALIMSNGNAAEDVVFAKKNFSGQAFEHSNNISISFVWRIWVP